MDKIREQLIEILNDVQRHGAGYTEHERYGIRLDDEVWNEEVADHLISKGVTIERWIPVTERLPSEEELERSPFYTFLVISSGEVKEAVYNDFGKYFSKRCGRLYGVTHWKPMPKPPIKQEESK